MSLRTSIRLSLSVVGFMAVLYYPVGAQSETASTARRLSEKTKSQRSPRVRFKEGLRVLSTCALPSTCNSISILLQNADFRLVHEQRDDIELRINYWDHFQIGEDGTIRQIDFARCLPGVYHTQNGRTIIGQGTVVEPGSSSSINMTPSGIEINGRKLKMERKRTLKPRAGLEMNVDGIFIDGRRLRYGSGARNSATELDVLQVAVPQNFKGELTIKSTSVLPGSVDEWSGGSFKIENEGNGELSVGSIKADCKLIADRRGRISIDTISDTRASIDAKSDGTINVKELHADEAEISCSSDAQVELTKGDSRKFSAIARGNSKISIGGSSDTEIVKAADARIAANDNGTILATSVAFDSCSVSTSQKGKITLRGTFDRIEEPAGSAGGISIQLVPPPQ